MLNPLLLKSIEIKSTIKMHAGGGGAGKEDNLILNRIFIFQNIFCRNPLLLPSAVPCIHAPLFYARDKDKGNRMDKQRWRIVEEVPRRAKRSIVVIIVRPGQLQVPP